MNFRTVSVAMSFAVASTVVVAPCARAQTVSPAQVTPSTLRPAPPPPSEVSLSSPAGAPVPKGSENLSIVTADVVVEGGFPELKDETDAIVSRLRGRRVAVREIYDAVGAIERAYGAHGFVLVRVAIPPQKLSNGGVLRLAVIDGYIEAVDVKGVPASQSGLVAARLANLIGRRHVTMSEIERRLLLAANIPGLQLSSTIARGANPGGARLILDATYKIFSGLVGFDDRLPSSLATYEWSSSLSLNSALGYGEQIYAMASAGYDLGRVFDATSPMELFGLGFVLPVGLDGFEINPEYTYTVTRPAPTPGSPASVGFFNRFDMRALYPVLMSRAQTINLQATVGWIDESLWARDFGADLYQDNYMVFRLQADDHLRFDFGAVADATLVFSQGLWGRDEGDAAASGIPLSEQGSSPTFSKLGFNGRWTQQLPQGLQGILIGQAQSSFGRPLFVSEQFSLDGDNAASGYPIGTFSVDEGATLRGELARPFAVPGLGALQIAPYVFAEGGSGRIDQATAVQQASITAGSFGIGFRGGADLAVGPLHGENFAVELARGLSDVPGERQDYRCNFSINVNF